MDKILVAVLLLLLLFVSACEMVDEARKTAEDQAKKAICKEKYDACTDFCERKGDFGICHSYCEGSYERCLS